MTVVVDVEVQYVSTGIVRVTVMLPLLIASRKHKDRIGQQQQQPQLPQPPPCYTARQLTAVVVSCPSFAGFETTPTFARNICIIYLINGLCPFAP